MLFRLDLLTLGLPTTLKLALRVSFGFCGVLPGSLSAFLNKSLMLARAACAGGRSKSDSGSEGDGGIATCNVDAGMRDGVSNRLRRARRRCAVSLDCVLLSGGGRDADNSLGVSVAYPDVPDSSSEVVCESRYGNERLTPVGRSDSGSCSTSAAEVVVCLVIRNLATDPE